MDKLLEKNISLREDSYLSNISLQIGKESEENILEDLISQINVEVNELSKKFKDKIKVSEKEIKEILLFLGETPETLKNNSNSDLDELQSQLLFSQERRIN